MELGGGVVTIPLNWDQTIQSSSGRALGFVRTLDQRICYKSKIIFFTQSDSLVSEQIRFANIDENILFIFLNSESLIYLINLSLSPSLCLVIGGGGGRGVGWDIIDFYTNIYTFQRIQFLVAIPPTVYGRCPKFRHPLVQSSDIFLSKVKFKHGKNNFSKIVNGRDRKSTR